MNKVQLSAMEPTSARKLELDITQVERLACPVCFGRLRLNQARLVCADCLRAYPIVDGIPVLIAERAEIAASGNASKP